MANLEKGSRSMLLTCMIFKRSPLVEYAFIDQTDTQTNLTITDRQKNR